MNVSFEGHNPAQSEAENQAKKLGKQMLVVKDNSGGIHYRVVDSIGDILPENKILDHYNEKGERVDVWVSGKVKVTQ